MVEGKECKFQGVAILEGDKVRCDWRVVRRKEVAGDVKLGR